MEKMEQTARQAVTLMMKKVWLSPIISLIWLQILNLKTSPMKKQEKQSPLLKKESWVLSSAVPGTGKLLKMHWETISHVRHVRPLKQENMKEL